MVSGVIVPTSRPPAGGTDTLRGRAAILKVAVGLILGIPKSLKT
jgi:hypothetical protein